MEWNITPIHGHRLHIGISHEDDFAQNLAKHERSLVPEALEGHGVEIATDRIKCSETAASINEIDIFVLPGIAKAKKLFGPATEDSAWQAACS